MFWSKKRYDVSALVNTSGVESPEQRIERELQSLKQQVGGLTRGLRPRFHATAVETAAGFIGQVKDDDGKIVWEAATAYSTDEKAIRAAATRTWGNWGPA